MYRCTGKSNAYVIFDCINWRDILLLGVHNFGGTTPRAARRWINIPTLQSYRLWSLLSARQLYIWEKENLRAWSSFDISFICFFHFIQAISVCWSRSERGPQKLVLVKLRWSICQSAGQEYFKSFLLLCFVNSPTVINKNCFLLCIRGGLLCEFLLSSTE